MTSSTTQQHVLTDNFTAVADRQVDANGYIEVRGKLARTGIQDYLGFELPGDDLDPFRVYKVARLPEHVFDEESLRSFDAVPVTMGHPVDGVNASNYTENQVGHVRGAPTRDGTFMAGVLTIRDADAVNHVQRTPRVEISNGYVADLIWESGTTEDGEEYDAYQTNIRGNHVALVDAARCGPECSIGDAAVIQDCSCASSSTRKGHPMSTIKVTYDGFTIDMTEAGKQALEKSQAATATADAKVTALTAELADAKSSLETANGKVTALEAEAEQNKVTDAQIEAAAIERSETVSRARSVLGDEADFSGKSLNDIRTATVAQAYGDASVKDRTPEAIAAMFDIATDAKTTHPTRETPGYVDSPVARPDTNKAYEDANKARSERWKRK